jgi:addiction module HigA family antidote
MVCGLPTSENQVSVSNGMRPVHPGKILSDELEEIGMSANALAQALAVPTNRVTAILKGQRGITADTALRLSRYFDTTPQLWLNLQKTFELRHAEIESGQEIQERVKPRVTTV